MYSGDLKSNHSKSGNIWNPKFLKIVFQMVWFSKGCGFKYVWINGGHLSGFHVVKWLPYFRSHSKSRPFANQRLFDHSKSKLVQFSVPHCIFWFTVSADANWVWHFFFNVGPNRSSFILLINYFYSTYIHSMPSTHHEAELTCVFHPSIMSQSWRFCVVSKLLLDNIFTSHKPTSKMPSIWMLWF